MKDKRQVPLKGDRALVLSSRFPGRVGAIINVLSDPFFMEKGSRLVGMSPDGVIHLLAQDSAMASEYVDGNIHWWIATSKLLRIPPDEEMKTMFAETEKPVKA